MIRPPGGGRDRILPSSHALVGPDGRFALGLRTQPFREVNPLDAKLQVGPLPVPRKAKDLSLKEWQHFALVNDDFYVSMAIFNAKRLGLVQIIVYDRRRDRILEYERRCLPRDLELAEGLHRGRCSFRKGEFMLNFTNRLERGYHELSFSAPRTRNAPSISGRVEVFEALDAVEPMVVALPFEDGRAMYSHKAVLPVEGVMQLGDQNVRFERQSAYALADIHKGYYPFVMTWHWATGALWRDGELVGFNLTNNQVRDQRRYNENGLWVDGRLSPLPPVRFEFNPRHHMDSWRIRDNFGRVELEFIPDTLRRVDINLGVMKSRYRGPFGRFRGYLLDDEDRKHDVEDAYGMCEDFYLRA